MTLSCNMTVDRKDHVQYLTVSKSYSDDCTCSLTEQNLALNNLYYGPKILFKKNEKYKASYKLIQILNKAR